MSGPPIASFPANAGHLVQANRAPCKVDILKGFCPQLLARGIEVVFDPVRKSQRQALSLQLRTSCPDPSPIQPANRF